MKKILYSRVRFLCVVGLLAVAVTVSAQEQNLNREMTLEREYDPSVKDANKVNTLPVIREPEVRKSLISYSPLTVPIEPVEQISVLPSGKIMTDIPYDKRRGYFNVGGGTYLNINGDFGYHILSNEIDQLNVFFSHRSTGGKREYLQAEGEKTDVKLNDNLGGLNFRHNLEKIAITLGAKYGYSAFNYFGYPIANPYSSSLLEADQKTRQVDQQIHADIGVQSLEGAEVGYLLNLGYPNFSHKYGLSIDDKGIKENIFRAKAGMSAAFGGNQRVAVEGKLNFFNYNLPLIMQDAPSSYGFVDHFQLTLSPYYTVEGDIWKVKLGANVMYISEGDAKVSVSPNVAADVLIANKTVFYVKADGGLQSNSAYEMSQVNRYVDPWAGSVPSRVWLDGIAGLKTGAAPGLWLNAFAGYKATKDDVLFLPDGNASGFGNYGTPGLFDTKKFFAGGEIQYSYQSLIELSLRGVFNNWDVSYTEELASVTDLKLKAYGRPKAEYTAGLDVRPINKLTFSAKYYLATGRYAALSRRIEEEIKMDNINELNFTGSYSVNQVASVYAQVNNLLLQKYDILYGYPAQGLGVLVGINVNF